MYDSLIVISCKVDESKYKSQLEMKSSIADAQMVMNTIYSLTYSGKESSPRLEYDDFINSYYHKLTELFAKEVAIRYLMEFDKSSLRMIAGR